MQSPNCRLTPVNMADKQELIRNAVAFLTDPKAQASPLAQRVQFLEAKGLTGPEIEEAMRLANSSGPHQPHINPQQPSYGPVYGPLPFVSPHHSPWDWRDYFITAVVSGSLAYGAVALARKYLFPHLQPPTSTAYEEDRDALTAQFDAAEALLKEIRAETSAVKTAVENQQEKVDKATADVEAAVQQMREGESRARDEMREIREEVNNIREMLPKMIEKNKEAQTQSLGELQQDLKSLKTLLLSRTPSTATPAPPLPNFPPRPSIPLWQLSDSSSNGTVLPVGTPSPSIVTPPPAPFLANGKGKEVNSDEP
ncbi:peroxisomal membrane anchor protein conserved region-domain-containing protein [Lactarius hatsudake]|nr:peroxisomal membrane anchor protein conserved region-domain-containing protein [Lactarius hatsudake]